MIGASVSGSQAEGAKSHSVGRFEALSGAATPPSVTTCNSAECALLKQFRRVAMRGGRKTHATCFSTGVPSGFLLLRERFS